MDPDSKNLLRTAGNYSYIGIFLGVAVLIGFLGGSWLDNRLHTRPWLSLAGLFVGLAAGGRELYRLARRGMREAQETIVGQDTQPAPEDRNSEHQKH